MYSALFLLLVPLALSAPSNVVRRQAATYDNSSISTEPRLPGILYINGEPAIIAGEGEMSVMASEKLCNPLEDDVLTCALNKRAKLLNPDDKGRSSIIASLPAAKDGSYFKLDYGAFLSQCEVGQPELVSKDGFKSCGIDTCSEEFSWTEVTTKSTKYGLKIGSTQKVSADPKLFKVEISLSEEFTGEWSNSDQTTISKKTTRVMKKGEVCAWASYQMFIDCDSKVDVGKFTIYTADGNQKFQMMNNVCTQYQADSARAEFVRGQGYDESVVNTINQVCKDVLFTPTGKASLDFTDGARTGNAWSAQGCMFE